MTPLLQLLADNRRPFTPISSRIIAAGNEATIYIYDPIVGDRATAEWFGGVCPQDFVPELSALKASTIHLRINSPGGDMFGAQAMAQALREHSANIVCHIDGLAASAATHIACAADSVVMSPGAMYMVHKSWTLAMGNADELRSTADLLDKADGIQIAGYMAKTGKPEAEVSAWVSAMTWFTAEEAMAAGFVDSIADSEPKVKAASTWNLRALGREAQEPPAASQEHRDRQAQRLLRARIV